MTAIVDMTAPVANSMLDAYGVRFNNGTLRVYSGAMPANADAPLGAATLLGTLTFAAQAFAAAANRSMDANPIAQDGSADATGQATFFRAYQSDGTLIEQGTVGATGSGAGLELNTTSIVQFGPISVSVCTRTL